MIERIKKTSDNVYIQYVGHNFVYFLRKTFFPHPLFSCTNIKDNKYKPKVAGINCDTSE